jgi:hypothetical protein
VTFPSDWGVYPTIFLDGYRGRNFAVSQQNSILAEFSLLIVRQHCGALSIKNSRQIVGIGNPGIINLAARAVV